MADRDHLFKLLQTNRRKLEVLELQKAHYGLNPPVDLVLSIEDTQAEIERLGRALAAMEAATKQIESVRVANSSPVSSGSNLFVIDKPIRVELIRIPAGEFLMGSDSSKDIQAGAEEQPQHSLSLAEFFIGKTPVTNAQFAVFLASETQWTPANWTEDNPALKGNHPVVAVTWRHATAFCEWLSEASGKTIRLPSEAEWEKAARGTDGRIYPWGDQAPSNSLCNYSERPDETTPVGMYPKGASPYGVLSTLGNVWEWTISLWGADRRQPRYRYPYDPADGRENLEADASVARVLRGGPFSAGKGHVRCALRNRHYPDTNHELMGFRVCSAIVQEGVARPAPLQSYGP